MHDRKAMLFAGVLMLFFSLPFAANAQLNFYESAFNGGVTGSGYSPAYNGGGTGNITISIAPGSTIQQAYLLGSRHGNAANLNATLNGSPVTFDASNQVTAFNDPVYGGPSGVHAIDVTALINPNVNLYSLMIPAQPGPSNRYNDFYLYVAYANPGLPQVETAIFLNTTDLNPNYVYNCNVTNPIDYSCDVGVAIFSGYICNAGADGEVVTINGNGIGTIGGADIGSGSCGGPVGSFYYENNTLNGLNDDVANATVAGTDALLNAMSYITNANTFTMTFTHASVTSNDNAVWGLILAHGSCCAATVNLGPDTTLCTGDQLLLDATGAGLTYLWHDNSTNATFNVTGPGTYWCEVTDGNCTRRDSIVVSYTAPPVIDLGPDTTLCSGTPYQLDATTAGATYLWQDNSTNATFDVTTTGSYHVAVSVGGCVAYDTVLVTIGANLALDLGPDTTLCAGQTLLLDATTPGVTYLWQDNSTNPTLNVSAAGTYWCEIDNGACVGRDSIVVTYITPPVVDLGPDTSFCNGTLLLDATNAGATYLWQDNSTNATFNVTATGTYYVDVSIGQCTATDTINVSVGTSLAVDIGPDTTLCYGETLLLDATSPGSTYTWHDMSTNPTYNVTVAGIYFVEVSNGLCMGQDTIVVMYTPIPAPNLGPDTTLCPGDQILLDASQPGATYLWQDNSTQATLVAMQAGTYWVEVTDGNCVGYDTIDVANHQAPVFSLGPDTSVCDGQVVNFDVTTAGATYLWHDMSALPTNSANSTGTYHVELTLNNCLYYDSVDVTVIIPPVVDLGPDISFCDGGSTTLDAGNPGSAYLWNDNSTAQTLVVNTTGTYSVVADIGGCTDADTIDVTVNPLPVVDLGPDQQACEGDQIVLDVTLPGATYAWQNASNAPTDTVTTGGTYWVNVTDANLCEGSDTIQFFFGSVPIVDAGRDTLICENAFVIITANAPSANSFDWNEGSVIGENILVEESGLYVVTAYNQCGTDMDTVEVYTENCDCFVYVPNAFTDDNDGINDWFGPEFYCDFLEYEFRIFNRWGQLLFTSETPGQMWDGTYMGQAVQQDVYIWQLTYKNAKGEKKQKKQYGHVTVIR